MAADEKKCPRVLVISNNCFRDGGSNGKVLQELFEGWDPDRLAQFYIYDELPDHTVCRNFFRVTDREATRSFLSGKKYGHRVLEAKTSEESASQNAVGGIERNPLTCLLRDIVWNSGRWKNKAFCRWIEEFEPQLILLQVGDSSLTAKIAMDVSKKYHVPIALYCTENYYFKKHNYFAGAKFGFVYPLFRWQMTAAFRKLMKQSVCEIYNSEPLAQLYEKEFKKPGRVIYQATSLQTLPPSGNGQNYRFCYTGNLGLKRHEVLIEIAQALQSISPHYYLDVYGRATDTVMSELEKEKGIRFHGQVPYSRVIEAMEQSDFLFHAESFDPFMVKDLATAFSTKIADSLASGRCFVLYAHDSLACTRYLADYDCACVITKAEDLCPMLTELIGSVDLQTAYIARADAVVCQNHVAKKNSQVFRKQLERILNENA